VFIVHGLNDWNVMTKAFAEWWYRLADLGVTRKIWLHNGGHGGESQTADAADFALYKTTENRWFDFWLFGVQNGITSEPRAASSARMAATSTRPTGRCPVPAKPGSTCPPPAPPHPAGCPRARGTGAASRASSIAGASSTPTTC
jgi:hypothetical protein